MTQPFEHCRLACPYWLSTIRSVQVPPLADADVPVAARGDFATIVRALQSGTLPTAGPAVERTRGQVGRGTPAEAYLTVVASLIRLHSGDAAGAGRLLDDAVGTHAQSAAVHQARGVVRLRQQDFAGAIESFNACVSINPDAGDAWAALTVMHSLERDHASTEQAARQALRLGALQHGLVPLALMQATYMQGKPVEGAMDFSSLRDSGEARVTDWLARFPPIDPREMSHRHGLPVYLIYADHNYVIEHAIPLLLSLKESRAKAAVHLHVANPGRGLRDILARVRATLGDLPLNVSSETVLVEQYAAPSIYHSCMRFVRMYQLLVAGDSPVIMLDADVLVRRDPTPLIEGPSTDVVVSRSIHDPLWSTYYGGYLQVNPTIGGRAYLGQVAAFILDNILKGTARWFLDQTALAVCCDSLAAHVRFREAPEGMTRAQDYTGSEYFWTAVNENKYGVNPHTAEKQRLRATYGFLPETLEPLEQLELVGPPGHQMVVRTGDDGLGAALKAGVAWRKPEADILLAVLRPGNTIVEIGAKDGGMTVPMARHVGPRGRVFAFEPMRGSFQRLMANVVLNGVTNVFGRQRVCAASPGRSTIGDDLDSPLTIDALVLDACHLIRIDVDGEEGVVLEGAKRTILRHHPIVYVASGSPSLPKGVAGVLRPLGYRVFWNPSKGSHAGYLCLPPASRIATTGLTPVE